MAKNGKKKVSKLSNMLVKPTEKTAKKAVISSGLIAMAVMLSRGVITLLPDSMENYAKGIIALAGAGLAASTKNSELMLAGAGLSAFQLTELVKDFSKDVKTDSKFLATTLGIGVTPKTGTNIETGKTQNLGLGNPFYGQKLNWEAISQEVQPQYFN